MRTDHAAQTPTYLARALTETPDLAGVLSRVAEAASELVPGSTARIWTLEDGRLAPGAEAGGETRDRGVRRALERSTDWAARVAATRKPLVVDDTGAAAAAIPLLLRGQPVGVLVVVAPARDRFAAEALDLLDGVGVPGALAIQNAMLNRRYEELQQAYRELTLTQDQLLQSQKMEAIGRLAGGIAHDFNNLLTVIAGQTYMLRNQTGAGPVREGVERIEATVERAAELIRQLLAFSRKQVLQPGVLRLNAIVESMVPGLRRVIGEDVELATRLAPRLSHVKADTTQIEQVIMNLAVNARDAMPDGGRLTLETANVTVEAPAAAGEPPDVAPGAYVMLAVSDTGIGMDAETRRRLFEPFYTTKEPGKGTGLGLATVYGIVKQSGGHIWVASEPGRGARFTIYLPVASEAADVPTPPAPDDVPGGHETILLVEDEAEVRALVREVLQERGYRVVEAAGPREALHLASDSTRRFDLLVTDVVMPQMTGPALADLLTAEQPTMPVLFMSGYADSAVVEHGVLQTGRAYLQKPFTPMQLARVVRRVLDTARG